MLTLLFRFFNIPMRFRFGNSASDFALRNMNTKKHTDGPWHITKENRIHTMATFITVRDSHEGVIAGTHVNDEANARLISAAPDLLAALKKAIAHPISGDWYEEAAAAIAKAEGLK
jgi:hypothetical protein